ncbi:hypothetical protein ABIC22_004700 [Paenibacillus sp. PvP094]
MVLERGDVHQFRYITTEEGQRKVSSLCNDLKGGYVR